LILWALAQSRGDGHRSLVTLERVLSEYNEDLIFNYLIDFKLKCIKRIEMQNYELGDVHKRRLKSGGCPVRSFCGQDKRGGRDVQMRTSAHFGAKDIVFCKWM